MLAILEDDPGRTTAMRSALNAINVRAAAFFDNAPDMLVWLRTRLADVGLLSLDHDLGPNRIRNGEPFDPGCGQDLTAYLKTQRPSCPVIIHSSNFHAVRCMQEVLSESGWSHVYTPPYQDLEWVAGAWLSQVRRLLPQAGDGSSV